MAEGGTTERELMSMGASVPASQSPGGTVISGAMCFKLDIFTTESPLCSCLITPTLLVHDCITLVLVRTEVNCQRRSIRLKESLFLFSPAQKEFPVVSTRIPEAQHVASFTLFYSLSLAHYY